MARGTLDTLLRLRRLAVEEATRDLAAAMRTAERAALAHATLTAALAREHGVARGLTPADPGFEGYPSWHEHARPAVAAAAARMARAAQDVAAARVMLGDTRGAARAVEAAVEQRHAAARADASRRAQQELEDIVRRGRVAAQAGVVR